MMISYYFSFHFLILSFFLCDSISFRIFSIGKILTSRNTRHLNYKPDILSVVYQTVEDATEHVLLPSKLFIGNLSYTITENEVISLIETAVGKNLIKHTLVPKSKKSKKGFGYAFIDFKDPLKAQFAAQQLDGYVYGGKHLNTDLKREEEIKTKKNTRIEANTIFLANLDPSLTEMELINMCHDILGDNLVVSIERPLDVSTGNPRGFAFIEFVNLDTVDRAIAELNNVEVLDRLLSCSKMKRPSTKKIM